MKITKKNNEDFLKFYNEYVFPQKNQRIFFVKCGEKFQKIVLTIYNFSRTKWINITKQNSENFY